MIIELTQAGRYTRALLDLGGEHVSLMVDDGNDGTGRSEVREHRYGLRARDLTTYWPSREEAADFAAGRVADYLAGER